MDSKVRKKFSQFSFSAVSLPRKKIISGANHTGNWPIIYMILPQGSVVVIPPLPPEKNVIPIPPKIPPIPSPPLPINEEWSPV